MVNAARERGQMPREVAPYPDRFCEEAQEERRRKHAAS